MRLHILVGSNKCKLHQSNPPSSLIKSSTRAVGSMATAGFACKIQLPNVRHPAARPEPYLPTRAKPPRHMLLHVIPNTHQMHDETRSHRFDVSKFVSIPTVAILDNINPHRVSGQNNMPNEFQHESFVHHSLVVDPQPADLLRTSKLVSIHQMDLPLITHRTPDKFATTASILSHTILGKLHVCMK